MTRPALRIGIVSDTHDAVPASLHDALAGVDEILHAGNIASAEALAEIETIRNPPRVSSSSSSLVDLHSDM